MLDYSVAMLKNPLHENDPAKAYAYLQSRGLLEIEEVAEHMVQHGCAYDKADIVAIITKLVSCTRELLTDCYSVRLGDLGRFFLSAKSRGAVSLKKFTEENIEEININFVPSKEFENLRSRVSLHKVPSRAAVAATLAAQLEGLTQADWTSEDEEEDDEP